jgi:hypothetical protein
MPYEQKNNPFKKLMSNITSGLNIKAPNVKKEMDWKHGHGEFASKETRRKPGESKFQYDVRMKEKASQRAKSEYTTQEKKLHEQMSRDLTEQDDPMWNEPGYMQGKHGNLTPEINPNDLIDKSQVQNFGIVPGMSFGEAFKQAGKTAKRGDIFMWNDQPFIYEFKETSDSNSGDKSGTVPSHVLQVPAFADLTYEQYMKDSTNYLKGAENWLKENK